MLHSLPLGNAVHGSELLVGDLRGVLLESEHLGDVPLEEELQLPQVDEPRGVADYRGEETLVLLIAPELRFPVLPSGDDHRLQAYAVPEDEHVREEAQLPPGVLHRLRDDDLKLQVHLSVALGHVAEAGGDHSGIDHVVRHHLTVLVLHGVHQEHLLSVQARHPDGVPGLPAQHLQRGELLPVIAPELQPGGNGVLRQASGLTGNGAGAHHQESRGKYYGTTPSHFPPPDMVYECLPPSTLVPFSTTVSSVQVTLTLTPRRASKSRVIWWTEESTT